MESASLDPARLAKLTAEEIDAACRKAEEAGVLVGSMLMEQILIAAFGFRLERLNHEILRQHRTLQRRIEHQREELQSIQAAQRFAYDSDALVDTVTDLLDAVADSRIVRVSSAYHHARHLVDSVARRP